MFKTYNKAKILEVTKNLEVLSGKWAFKSLMWLALTGVALGVGINNAWNAAIQYGAFLGEKKALKVISDDIEE